MNSVRRKKRRRFFVVFIVFVVAWIVLVAGCNTRSGLLVWNNEVWSGSSQDGAEWDNSQNKGDLTGAESNKDGKDSPADASNESDGGEQEGTDDRKGETPDGGDDNNSKGEAPGGGDDNNSKGEAPGGGDDNNSKGEATGGGDDNNSKGETPGGGDDDNSKDETPDGGDDNNSKGETPGGRDDNSSKGEKPQGGAAAPEEDGSPNKPASSFELDKTTSPIVDYEAPSSAKLVALTFDDGPDKNYTMDILDILREYKLKATFFTVGIQVKKYPEIMKRIAQDGHVIGNHSYHHPNLSKLDSKTIKEEIKWTDHLIEKTAGYVPRLVRAPYGALSPLVRSIMKDNNRELIGWTVDTRDWAGESVARMRANVNKNTKPGGIILMHSFGSKHLKNTVELLPLIIEDLSKKGYTFVTVDELLSANEQRNAAEKK
ncbi:hypothetical protein PAECIP111893_03598 [Paenibacillus plantiphilus]|uniref:NodB homology domain-containing protein n=1 Tax=Paenibacillus plantiphilus TaxID=2905650 RepID=A0ABM9CHP1_9BACL|nr:polysaccharide deacetylase family protein [Paenibacillus plantiphilus]CAH1212961.1 hypothetical protein PAECIP111893_03598 [Paenibacillus plantiphilus]